MSSTSLGHSNHILFSALLLTSHFRLELLFWPTEVWVRGCGQRCCGSEGEVSRIGIVFWDIYFPFSTAGWGQRGAVGEISSSYLPGGLSCIFHLTLIQSGSICWLPCRQVVSKSICVISLSSVSTLHLLWWETLGKIGKVLPQIYLYEALDCKTLYLSQPQFNSFNNPPSCVVWLYHL